LTSGLSLLNRPGQRRAQFTRVFAQDVGQAGEGGEVFDAGGGVALFGAVSMGGSEGSSSGFGRKSAFKEQVLSQHHPHGIVNIEHLNRHDSRLGLADQEGVVPVEVTAPVLPARVEERIQLAVQQSGQIRPFGLVAFGAGPTERVRVVNAAMLPGDHVLDVEDQNVVVFVVNAAVFTLAACPLPDEGPERGIHPLPGELASSWRAFDLRMATKVLKET